MQFSTTIFVMKDGSEIRVINWADGRIRFNANPGLRSRADILRLRNFHIARRGAGHSFPVRDMLDFEFVDGNGLTFVQFATFATGTYDYQLAKQYGDVSSFKIRKITKPEQGTIRVRWGGVIKTEGTHYTVNYLTGIVSIAPAHVPANGTAIEVSGQFYTPCRFMDDELPADQIFYKIIDKVGGGPIPIIGLIEVRNE